MKHTKAEHLPRNIFWQEPIRPERCEHRYELVASENGPATRRCMKCGCMEAK